MKKIFKILILILVIMQLHQIIVYAEGTDTEEILKSQQESLNLSDFISESQKYVDEYLDGVDVGKLLNSATSGKIEDENIIKSIFNVLGKEVKDAIRVMRKRFSYCLNT